MKKASITPHDGRWRVRASGIDQRYVELEEAVEEARSLMRAHGGGTVEIFDRAGLRDRISVPPIITPAGASERELSPPPEEPRGVEERMSLHEAAAALHARQEKERTSRSARDSASRQTQGGSEADSALMDSLDSTQRAGIGLLLAGATLGPLGLGFLAATEVLFGPEIPSSEQVAAIGWLFIITLPLAVFVAIVVIGFGRASFPVLIGAAAIAAVIISAFLANSPAPTRLGDFYCYAEVKNGAVEYEKACRDFDHAGFVAENAPRASPTGAPVVLGSLLAYTSEARGSVMALASILAAIGVGLLIRHASESA